MRDGSDPGGAMVDALILGAGPAGLAAALFAARRGHRVTVLEGDPPPPDAASPDDDFAWSRRGVPHARQGHVFLARSTAILRNEAPDVLDGLRDRGAMVSPIDGGEPATAVLCRRLVYEAVLRRTVEREPGITILSNVAVTGLCTAANGVHAGVPRVIGARTKDGASFHGDVVVDATGRKSRAPQWLREVGAAEPVEVRQPCGFFYVTRHYQLRSGHSLPDTSVPMVAALGYITVLAFAGDNGRFQLSVAASIDDPHRRHLLGGRVFERFLAEVPLTRPWLECGEPMGEPEPMAGIENRRRCLTRNGAPVVTGFLLLGDASVQTNPTTGRGVSLALMQAAHFAGTLERASGGADGATWVADFEQWTDANMGAWLASQMEVDGRRVEQLAAGLRGETLAPPTDPTNRFIAALAVLRDDDPEIRRLASRMYNLLIPHGELASNRAVMRKVLAYVRAHPRIEAPSAGPDRARFERLVTADGWASTTGR